MKRVQQGFTLIELMIVVAIIGILAAIAIPQYAEYTNRAKVSEGLQLAAAAKTGVSEYYSANKEAPDTNNKAGIADAADIKGKNVTSVAVSGAGLITVTYKDLDADVCNNGAGVIVLAPTFNKGSVSWAATAATSIGPKCLPANLRKDLAAAP